MPKLADCFSTELSIQGIDLFLNPTDPKYYKDKIEDAQKTLLDLAKSQNIGTNIEFLFDVLALFNEQLSDPNKTPPTADKLTALFQRFIHEGAPSRIQIKTENLPDQNLIPNGNLDLFTNAISEIVQSIKSDLLPKLNTTTQSTQNAKPGAAFNAAELTKKATDFAQTAYHTIENFAKKPEVQEAVKSIGNTLKGGFAHLKETIQSKLAAKQKKEDATTPPKAETTTPTAENKDPK